MDRITIVGGGIAGLIAATECAEAGAPVRLLEARSSLGGRAATTPPPFLANLGPHAFYLGPLWSWLAERDLHRPYRIPRSPAIKLRWQGDVTRVPPRPLRQAFGLRKRDAPVGTSLGEWLTDLAGSDAARAVAGAAAPLTFDHDPGRLSAAFVWEKVRRFVFSLPPARYVEDGWGAVIERTAARARGLGLEIETSAKVDDLDALARTGPVVLAVGPRAARQLTGDTALRVESPRVALLDLGLEARRGDPYLLVDLDEVAFIDRVTAVVPSLAPAGQSLVQASMGQRPGESLDDAVTRLEAALDEPFGGWRSREVWRRRATVTESTGALDLPGTTWRDRPSVAWTGDVSLCGDWVAAPGHLAEVGWASAVEAARRAIAASSPAVAVASS
jgi:phytoene dehydrogenase-like protein